MGIKTIKLKDAKEKTVSSNRKIAKNKLCKIKEIISAKIKPALTTKDLRTFSLIVLHSRHFLKALQVLAKHIALPNYI